MDPYELVKQTLAELDIAYEVVDHPAVTTTEAADKYIVGINGVRTKSMFLTNKKKTAFYLVIMDESKRLNFKAFSQLTGGKRLQMASAGLLQQKLGLIPGSVSIFGLINNTEHDVQVYIDHEIMGEARMGFHPNINTHTMFISTVDLMKFIKSTGNPLNISDLEQG